MKPAPPRKEKMNNNH